MPKRTHDKTETAWSLAKKNEYPTLEESFETDICIVGGGIAGILCAYLLHKDGHRVALIEKDRLGTGVTELTTAFLTSSIDTDFSDLIKIHGPDGARKIVESHETAIDLIEKIAKDETIECEFMRCSNFIFALTKKDMSILSEEYDAALELGLDATLEKDGSRLGMRNEGFIEIRNQGKFHPLKFISALAETLSMDGVRIFENTEATEILDRDFGKSVKALGHSIQAKWVISATYSPFGEPLRAYFKKGMYRTYMIEAHTEWKIPEGTYEDTENPYHYIRIDGNGSEYRILIGGEDHRDDLPASETKAFDALLSYLEERIPKESFTVRRRWTGPILEPDDGLALIGPLEEKDRAIFAFGFSGNGMTYGGISAMIARDLISGKRNSWYEFYRADRVPGLYPLLIKAKDYTEELLGGAVKNALVESKKPKKNGTERK